MGAGAIKAEEKMGQDKFLRKTACTRLPFYPRTTFHANWCQPADNGGNFQAIALPGLEATRDCPQDEREEGKALRRARRECRKEQVEDDGEEYSQDGGNDYFGNKAGDYLEQEDEQDLVDEYFESESENSLDSDLLDYEYHDNCSTYYDGRQVNSIDVQLMVHP